MSGLLGLADIPTLATLYALKRLPLGAKDSSTASTHPYNQRISLIRADITKLQVDAIVNAANSRLAGGGGVDGAIQMAAGPGLLKECRTLGGCDTGSAKITSAHKLPCKNVIHAVGPIYHLSQAQGTPESLLQGCYRRSLELAVENKLKSIAFPAISTGVYGYPSDEAAEIAAREVRSFLDSGKGDSLERIIICTFADKDQDAYENYLPKIFPPAGDVASSKNTDTNEASDQKSEPESSKPQQGQPSDPQTPDRKEAPDAEKQNRRYNTRGAAKSSTQL